MQLLVKGDKAFYRNILVISLPIVAQSLITMGVNATDTVMLGSFGEQQLSAASISNQFYSIFQIFCMGLGGGAAVMTARFWGSKNRAGIRKVVAIMLRIALVAAVGFTLLMCLAPGAVLRLYTTDTAIVGYGEAYYSFLSWTFLLQGISMTVAIVLRSVGRYNVPLIASASSFLLNIFFNWVFMFGKLGAPRLEIRGAAIGTLIARIVECSIILLYLLVKDKQISFRPKDLFASCGDVWQPYLKYSAPVIVSDIMLALGANFVAVIMMKIGTNFVAANAITNVTVQISTFFTLALANSASIIIGNTLGRGEKALAQVQGTTFLVISAVLGVLAAGLIQLLKPNILGLYAVQPETKQIAAALMDSVSLIVVFRTTSSVLTKGILRGGGDTRYMMVADVLFLWIGSIPLGSLAGLVWQASPFVIYFCLNIDLLIKTVWCTVRLFTGKWIKELHGTQNVARQKTA